MQYISHELIYFIRAILFGIAVYYAFFYFFLYFKPMVEGLTGVKKYDTDLWWMLSITISIVMGAVGAILLM
jgi:hypothetical protein